METRTDPQQRDHAVREIEQLCPRLREDLRFSLRQHAGEASYVVEDPLAGSFYRIGMAEFAFLSELDGKTTLAEIVARTSIKLGPDAFSTEEATAICQWLLETGLATTDDALQAKLLLDRSNRLRQEAFRRRSNPFFLRLPLVNPDLLLRRLAPLAGIALSWPARLIWLGLLMAASLTLVRHWDVFTDSTSRTYLQNHWLWIGVTWILIKIIHEMAHGTVCRYFGGQAPEAGVFFIFLVPIPYVDVTSAWRFGSKWQRIATGGAGIYVELFLAAVALLVWSQVASETVRTIAQSVALTSGITTLLFNLNVLMRFDGYYMLVDLLEVPNLYSRGQQYVQFLFRRYYLGIAGRSPLHGVEYSGFVRLYSLAAFVWRWVISFSLIGGAIYALGELGWVVAAAAGFAWVILPAFRVTRDAYFGSARQPARPLRFTAITLTLIGLVAWGLSLSWPASISIAAVVDHEALSVVRAGSAGFAREVHVAHGDLVQSGDPLVTLENPELKSKLTDLQLVRDGIVVKRRRDLSTGELAAYQARLHELKVVEQQIEELERRVDNLVVRARTAGHVVSSEPETIKGQYFDEGDEVISIGDQQAMELVLCVGSADFPAVQQSLGQPAQVWVWGGETISINLPELDPRAVHDLPHPALAATVGGSLPVRVPLEESQTESLELVTPCFVGRVGLPIKSRLLAGQRATVTFTQQSETVGSVLWRRLPSPVRSVVGFWFSSTSNYLRRAESSL